jgi:hypothetical protein
MSVDDEFTLVGALSQMDYWSSFKDYLTLANELEGFEGGRDTLKMWNEVVFAGTAVTPPVATERIEGVAEIFNEIEARRNTEAIINRGASIGKLYMTYFEVDA